MRANRSSRITVNLTPEEMEQLLHAANSEGRSLSNLCYLLIQEYLAQRTRDL